MKSFELLSSARRNPDGTLDEFQTAELYENPLWREIVGEALYWIDLHKPRWFDPGNGRPTVRHNDDGTCTFLWRLNLELWLGYEFQHKRRKVLHRVRIET
jgi:hypothetical protein